PFVLTSRQFGRNGFLSLGIEIDDIGAIDRLSLFRRWIGARDVEIPIHHEVVIAVAAACLPPSRKARVAVRHQGPGFSVRYPGLNQLDAFFEIPGEFGRGIAKGQPEQRQRKQSSREPHPEAIADAQLPQITHAQKSPTDSLLVVRFRSSQATVATLLCELRTQRSSGNLMI